MHTCKHICREDQITTLFFLLLFAVLYIWPMLCQRDIYIDIGLLTNRWPLCTSSDGVTAVPPTSRWRCRLDGQMSGAAISRF